MGYVSGIAGMGYLGDLGAFSLPIKAGDTSPIRYKIEEVNRLFETAERYLSNKDYDRTEVTLEKIQEVASEHLNGSQYAAAMGAVSKLNDKIIAGRAAIRKAAIPSTPTRIPSTPIADLWEATPVQLHPTWYSTGKVPTNARIANGYALWDTSDGLVQIYNKATDKAISWDGTAKHPLSSFQNIIIRGSSGKKVYESRDGSYAPASSSEGSSGGVLSTIGDGIASLFTSIATTAPKVAPQIAQAVARRAQRQAQIETQEARAGLPSWALPVAGVVTLVAVGYWMFKPKAVAAQIAAAPPSG